MTNSIDKNELNNALNKGCKEFYERISQESLENRIRFLEEKVINLQEVLLKLLPGLDENFDQLWAEFNFHMLVHKVRKGLVEKDDAVKD
jgi:hypothetical protein